MTKLSKTIAMLTIGWLTITSANAQDMELDASHTLYDFAPRKLVDLPTAGTLPKGTFQIGLRIYAGGGALGYTDIGLSNRFSLGIAYGGTDIVSNGDPEWNPRIGFNLKFRIVDELEFFPAIAIGFSDQGYGGYRSDYERYTYKSRGFYGVVSRSFYFYKWTSGWHFGVNYSREHDVDNDKDINFFGGFDATFNYNLAILAEYDAALNDNKGDNDHITGKGRGYLNVSIKWLFAENLELELLLKDLLINRWESETLTREVRMMYIDNF
ncbi:MAG: YjbH domain-containing protein [candidate division Zixibacteria bacterium]|nr:YjbH domain-containing protein [candidate division Zixibacteria bacterium]